MSEVIPFGGKPPEPPALMIWVCGQCSSQNFRLRSDGLTECAMCETVAPRGNWKPEALVVGDGEVPDYTREIADHGSPDLARESILRSAKGDGCVLVAIFPDGRIRAWCDPDRVPGVEWSTWLTETMTVATDLMLANKKSTEQGGG